jgi:cytochrome c oxidase subunit 1
MENLSSNKSAELSFFRRYVFTTDHKAIGLQYLLLSLFAVLIGVILSLLMRWQLAWPLTNWPILGTLFPQGAPNGVMQPGFYLSLVTMHGTLMIFFVLTLAPQSGFGNYILPLQIGAREMVHPRLNALSFWITLSSLLVLLSSIFVEGGNGVIGSIAGWTAYPPLSALDQRAGAGQGAGMNLWLASIALFCIGSLFSSINFIATFLKMRARGLTLMRLPLTCWSWFTTAVLALIVFPVLLAALLLLFLDRAAETSFFLPANLYVANQLVESRKSGSPLLWQHLFWFFGHPEVYIAILPGMGVTSHIISTFARKPIFGYRAMVFATVAIAFLGLLLWGHHMFTSGLNPNASIAFSVLTLAIAVPSSVKTFNWLATLWRGRLRLQTPMLYAIGFVSLFVAGGLTGTVLGQSGLDAAMHDTYFVVAHFHLVMGASAVFALFAATSFWFPKMFGRAMNEKLGQVHFFITFIGVYAVFVPMHAMGLVGMPRRYASFEAFEFLKGLHPLVKFVTISAIVTAAAQLLFFANIFWSIFKGEETKDNHWEATTLEWTISPSRENLNSELPIVYRGAYEFSIPHESSRDFIMQTEKETFGKEQERE